MSRVICASFVEVASPLMCRSREARDRSYIDKEYGKRGTLLVKIKQDLGSKEQDLGSKKFPKEMPDILDYFLWL